MMYEFRKALYDDDVDTNLVVGGLSEHNEVPLNPPLNTLYTTEKKDGP